MNHAITIGGLLLGLCVLVGIIMAGFGALMTFAAGMSTTGRESGGGGCVTFLLGLALLVGGIWGLLS